MFLFNKPFKTFFSRYGFLGVVIFKMETRQSVLYFGKMGYGGVGIAREMPKSRRNWGLKVATIEGLGADFWRPLPINATDWVGVAVCSPSASSIGEDAAPFPVSSPLGVFFSTDLTFWGSLVWGAAEPPRADIKIKVKQPSGQLQED